MINVDHVICMCILKRVHRYTGADDMSKEYVVTKGDKIAEVELYRGDSKDDAEEYLVSKLNGKQVADYVSDYDFLKITLTNFTWYMITEEEKV